MESNEYFYWCFLCKKEVLVIDDDDGELKCEICQSTFVEEIPNKSNKNAFISNLNNNNFTEEIQNSNKNNINSPINIENNKNNKSNNFNNKDLIDLNQTDINIDDPRNFNIENIQINNTRNRNTRRIDINIPLLANQNAQSLNSFNSLFNFPGAGFGLEMTTNGISLNLSNSLIFNNGNNMNMNMDDILENILPMFNISGNRNYKATEEQIKNLKKITLTKENLEIYTLQDCIICADEFLFAQEIIVLECTHYFHDKCIIAWIKKKFQCPICRKKFYIDNDIDNDS